MITVCEFCDRKFRTFNSHRTSCYECKIVYPSVNSNTGREQPTFNRRKIIALDKRSRLINPEKRTRW